jgi:hypothetical protein
LGSIPSATRKRRKKGRKKWDEIKTKKDYFTRNDNVNLCILKGPMKHIEKDL